MANIYNRYFVFSQKQMDIRKKAESSPKFGTVVVNGIPKTYTDILLSPNQNDKLFPDSVILIEGDIRKLKFTNPS